MENSKRKDFIMNLTKEQEERRKLLQELQADHTRWFSEEEFNELQKLNAILSSTLLPSAFSFRQRFKLLFKPDLFKEKTVGFCGCDMNIEYLTLDSNTQKIFVKYISGNEKKHSSTFSLTYEQAKRDGIINLDNLKKYLK